MTAMAVCGFVFYLSSDMFVAYTQSQRRARASVALMKVQKELVSLLRDEAAWSQTVAAQSAPGQPFRCLTTASSDCTVEASAVPPLNERDFVPYKSDGTLYNGYNPVANARHGFTPEGTLCTTFNPANPDPNCPFRFTFTRQFLCGADCVKPLVNLRMDFDPRVLNALNIKLINVSTGMMTQQPVLARGIARVVTPRDCGPGQVVTRVTDQGVVECRNWLLLP